MVHTPATAPHSRDGDDYHRLNGKHNINYENPPSPEESSNPSAMAAMLNGAADKKQHHTNGILQHCFTYPPQQNRAVFNLMENTQTVLSSDFAHSTPGVLAPEPRKRGKASVPRKRAPKAAAQPLVTTAYTSELSLIPTNPPAPVSLQHLPVSSTLSAPFSPSLPSPISPLEQPRIDLKADVETDISDDEIPSRDQMTPEQRLLSRKWEKTRCSLAWRWTWLQLQVNELEFQSNKCDELFQKKRRNKQKVLPLIDPDEKQHALRASGLSKPIKNRKLYRVPSSKSKSSSSLDKAAESHPLFSVRQVPKRPAKRKREEPPKLEKNTPKPTKRTVPSESQSLRTSSNKSKNKARKKARLSSSRQQKKKGKEKEEEQEQSHQQLTLSQQQLQLQQQQQSLNMKKKKKYLRTSDFDIDNYIMPYGMAVTPVIPELEYSEIQTPTWRIIEEVLDSISDDESEEDITDEKFAMRHFPHELFERKRYLEPLTQKKRRGGTMPRIPSRGNLSSDFPDEFLVTPLDVKDQEELKKLEEKKLQLIQDTYLNHINFKPRRWEDITPPDHFDPRRFIWEIIRDRLSPNEDEKRNIIYLRRIPKPLGEEMTAGDEWSCVDGVDGGSAGGGYGEWRDENGGATDEDETDVEFLLEGEEDEYGFLAELETDDGGEYSKKKKRTRKR